jgi:hypothetical protein
MINTQELLRFVYKVKEGDLPIEDLQDEAISLLIAAGYITPDEEEEV